MQRTKIIIGDRDVTVDFHSGSPTTVGAALSALARFDAGPMCKDFEAVRQAPGITENRLTCPESKALVQACRRLADPLPSPLMAFDGACVDAVVSSLGAENHGDDFAVTVRCGAVMGAFNTSLIRADFDDPTGLWTDIMTDQGLNEWIFYTLDGVRVNSERALGPVQIVTTIGSSGVGCAVTTVAMMLSAQAALIDLAKATPLRRDPKAAAGFGLEEGAFGFVETLPILREEEVWQVLSKAIRAAKAAKEQRLVLAGIVTLRGCGRKFGPVRSNILLRFGVSKWQ